MDNYQKTINPSRTLERLTGSAANLTFNKIRGDEALFFCPWCQDTSNVAHGNLEVNMVSGLWHCWGCNRGGSLTKLCRVLDVAPVYLTAEELPAYLERMEGMVSTKAKRKPKSLDVPPEVWDKLLASLPSVAVEALSGVPEDILKRYRVCYDEDSDSLLFPYIYKGRTIGIMSRGSRGDYIKEPPGIVKHPGLFGDLDSREVIIVEGPRDACRVLQAGLSAVCVYGSRVTRDHLKQLDLERAILLPDSDGKLAKSYSLVKIYVKDVLVGDVNLVRKEDPYACKVDEIEYLTRPENLVTLGGGFGRLFKLTEKKSFLPDDPA